MSKQATSESTNTRKRLAIIHLLKQEGPIDAAAMSSHLRVTAMAVRQHLYELQKEGLVTYSEEPRPKGRPAKLWQLTSAANRLFPDGYAELTLNLINSVKEAFGDDGLDRLLTIRTSQQIAAYLPPLSLQESLRQRLELLADLRTEEGYMAEVQSLPDDVFLFIENHCPICAAATACTGFCSQELEVFQTVLGRDVVVERTEHIISNERRCVYKVFYRKEK